MRRSYDLTGMAGPDFRAGAAALADSAQAIARSKEELLSAFRGLIGEGEALLRSTASLSGETLAQARERFRGSLADARTRVADVSRVAMDGGLQAAAATHGYVRRNPWTALGVAAGVGFVIGALLTRR